MGEDRDSWTGDRFEAQRPDVPHHPFQLSVALPTTLDPAHTRSVEIRGPSVANVGDHVRRALTEQGYAIVSQTKLLTSHHAKSRAYPKGTEILLGERNVRVDVTQSERGRQRSRLYFAGMAASLAAFVILDLTIPSPFWWVFPVTGAIAVFLILGLLSFTTSTFGSEVIVVAIAAGPAPDSSRDAVQHAGLLHAVEICGAFALSKNYSSKSGSWRNVVLCAIETNASHAVDAIADQLLPLSR